MYAAVSVMVCYSAVRGREMEMCVAVSVMVCYREGEREGNGYVCCSWRYGFLQDGGDGGKR